MTDSAPDPRSSIAFELLRAIRRIVRHITIHSRALAAEAGLTVPQLLCLKAIGDSAPEPMTVAGLAARVSLSPTTTSRIVERLVRSKLVSRERGERDRRRVRLSLTPDGQRRHRELPRPLQDRFLERLERLPAADQEHLLDALREILVMMDAEEVDAAPFLVPDEEIEGPDLGT